MDGNVVNIEIVSLWWCFYVLSNTKAEIKQSVAYKKNV